MWPGPNPVICILTGADVKLGNVAHHVSNHHASASPHRPHEHACGTRSAALPSQEQPGVWADGQAAEGVFPRRDAAGDNRPVGRPAMLLPMQPCLALFPGALLTCRRAVLSPVRRKG